MKHIIKMLHRLTEDETGVYLSCEENGKVIFVSDLKKNGMFHYITTDGLPSFIPPVYLFLPGTQKYSLGFIPNHNTSPFSGRFEDANHVACGNISTVGTGSERHYVANVFGKQYECYMWAVGSFPCMMFYQNGIQKAMMVEDKLSVNQRFSMTIHIIDDEDILVLCMLGFLYHEFENVYNLNSTFHRSFIRNGWCTSFCENVANYHFEFPIYGIGKDKYNVHFLKQFYSPENFPYSEDTLSVGTVMKETGTGLREATGSAWTKENLNATLKNPISIVLLAGIPILGGIISGCICVETYFPNIIGFIIGFLAFFLFIGIGEGIFILFFYLLIAIFSKK